MRVADSEWAAMWVQWPVPDHSFSIHYRVDALETLRAHVSTASLVGEGKQSSCRDCKLTGLLLGSRTGAGVSVESIVLLPEPGGIIDLAYSDRLMSVVPHGRQAVGWCRISSKATVQVTPEELRFHNRYFSHPLDIALIARPSLKGTLRAGFFFRENDGTMRTRSSYQEIVVAPPLELPKSAPAQPFAKPHLVEVPEDQLPEQPILSVPASSRSNWRPLLTVLGVALAMSVPIYLIRPGGGGTRWTWIESAAAPPPAQAPVPKPKSSPSVKASDLEPEESSDRQETPQQREIRLLKAELGRRDAHARRLETIVNTLKEREARHGVQP